jgi:hypothetical protein
MNGNLALEIGISACGVPTAEAKDGLASEDNLQKLKKAVRTHQIEASENCYR